MVQYDFKKVYVGETKKRVGFAINIDSCTLFKKKQAYPPKVKKSTLLSWYTYVENYPEEVKKNCLKNL